MTDLTDKQLQEMLDCAQSAELGMGTVLIPAPTWVALAVAELQQWRSGQRSTYMQPNPPELSARDKEHKCCARNWWRKFDRANVVVHGDGVVATSAEAMYQAFKHRMLAEQRGETL